MAGECTETSSMHNWWPDLHACTLSSWISANNSSWQLETNNNSESSGEESVSMSTSFTNASNHSGLTAESSHGLVESASTNELIGETTASDNHLWNHVLLTVGSSGDLYNSQHVGENLLDTLPSKTISDCVFDPPCDYSKKMDNAWVFSNSTSFNTFNKQLNVLNDSPTECQRLTKSSYLLGNRSIQLQDAQINNQFAQRPYHINQQTPVKDPFSDLSHEKQNFGSISCFGHDVKAHEEHGGTVFGRSFDNNRISGYPMALSNSTSGDRRRHSCTNSRSLNDLISSASYLSRPLLDINLSKPLPKTLDLSGCRKQAFQSSPFSSPKSICNTLTKIKGRIQGHLTTEGKKRKSEENSDAQILKKPKQEASTLSFTKVPKVKITDKITALQQIVSPFGKTDTASVLWEAIGYIRFLQEQIQLLSNPYMRGNSSKDLWGGLERKDRGDAKLDLKSRGLCLVPISFTPQVYRENSGSDYLTPVYRGCLYR